MDNVSSLSAGHMTAKQAGLVSVLSILVGVGAGAPATALPQSTPDRRQDLTELSLEELVNVQVVSVQKRPEPLKDTPAAVTVITSEEIGGSSATSIPALLRRVPGV